ncbi:hypothetical protein KY314_03615 [Candidatus Woesearchaeota archaeon]|nr:hypothetical protein [Candidatus Woesearchaeota archaeon]
MTEAIDIKKLYEEIKTVRQEIGFIKKHMFDPDSILTNTEAKRFEQSLKDLKQGKTTSLSEFKKELGI